MEVTADNLS